MVNYNDLAYDIRKFDYNQETNKGLVRGTRS